VTDCNFFYIFICTYSWSALCCKLLLSVIIIIIINLHSHVHGYEDVTIHHRSTSKNPITLLNFPYIHSHIQSHSPRAPPWPSSPAFCGLDLAVNQYASLLALLQRELSTNKGLTSNSMSGRFRQKTRRQCSELGAAAYLERLYSSSLA